MPALPRSATMSVAPNSRAIACRSAWRDIATMRSAPRRAAASTAHRPTAPSPTTTTVLPALTSAETAAWWPVPITSDSVSRLYTSVSSGASEVATRVPSAMGTRTHSPWPPSTGRPYSSLPPHQAPCSHEVCIPLRQWMHVPSLIAKGAMTKSPRRMDRTSEPASSTMPTNSCPIRVAGFVGVMPRYGHRSEPQTQEATTRTSTSVERRISGSGTSSTRMSRGP